MNELAQMTQRWAGPVTDVFDMGSGMTSVTYDDPAYATRGNEPPTTSVPLQGINGHVIVVGDQFSLEQNFADGTAVARVNGEVYYRWTNMARR